MSQAGRTLIEMMFVVAIGLLILSQVAPSLDAIYQRSRATSSINWIIGVVNYARHAAINKRVTVTLCPAAAETLKCKGKWHHGVIMFADHNEDAKFNGDDYLIDRVSADRVYGSLKWRAFRNRQYLQMTAVGYTRYQNGNFVFCPISANPRFARQIVINVQGRARMIHSKDKQGRPVDRKGKPLRC